MKVENSLTAYRAIMVFVHLFFSIWVFGIFGLGVKTFLFLTNMNFFANFYYFFYNSFIRNQSYRLADGLKSSYEKQKKKSLQEIFSNSLFKFCFCMGIAVNILYWSLNIFAPSLLGTTHMPIVLDLFLHGGNLLVLFVDYLLDEERDRGNHRMKTRDLLFFSVFYVVMQYVGYYSAGIEVYPLIAKLSVPQFSMLGVAGYGLFMTGHYIYERILV